jgi:hypothetical protein
MNLFVPSWLRPTALILCVAACAERQSPFEPARLAPSKPAFVLEGVSGEMPLAIISNDPAFTAQLPTYPDSVIAVFRVDGYVGVKKTDAADENKKSGPVDGQGYYRINGCWLQVQFIYTTGYWGPGVCGGAYKGLWIDTAAVRGTGTIKRSGKIFQEDYECYSSPCWSYTNSSPIENYSITPIPVPINLTTPGTAESAPGVINLPPPGYGTTVRVSSTPTTLKGIQVPVRVVSWSWTARPGGDGATSVGCTGTKILCSMTFTETGTLVVTAVVNGVEQSDTLTVRAPEVQISAAKSSMRPSVRYTRLDNVVVSRLSKQIITVSVMGETGPIPYQTVTLLSTAKDGSAGHVNHPANTKPRGGFRTGSFVMQFNTGSTGSDTVTFVAPDPSGPVTITGTISGGRKGQAKINVEVAGLVKLPGNHPKFDTTGATTIHPDNHWVTQSHFDYLVALATGFSFYDSKKLTFNDSSLESGGLFDNVDDTGFWTYPHRTPRHGRETDLKTKNTLDDDQKDIVRWIWTTVNRGDVRPEGDHWHLTNPN